MICRFQFVEGTDMKEVEATVGLAFLAAGCLIGEPRLRLETGNAISHEKRSVVIRANGDCECVLMLFVGFCSHEYGETSFTVEKVVERATALSEPKPCEVCGGTKTIPIPDPPKYDAKAHESMCP